MKFRISIAVPAYNEEKNIGLLIDSLRAQQTERAIISEIVVIASGCTDHTLDIVRERQARPGTRVCLIEETVRRGKVAAINAYLRHERAPADAICLCSADLLVTDSVVEKLAQCLLDHPDIGMCGARPVPTNGHGTFPGEATRFLWQMHHRVALEAPKLGELVMLRAGIVHGLPEESVVDEATLEQHISSDGYRLAYVPDAVVHNHGPETLADFIRQRRRISAGHYWLRDTYGYTVSTMNLLRTARLTLSELSIRRPRKTMYALGTVFLEVFCRVLGWWDFRTDSQHHGIWKVAETTKAVLTDEIRSFYNLAPEECAPRPAVSSKWRRERRAESTL